MLAAAVRAQPRDVPAAVDGRAARARLPGAHGDDAGVDRALDRLAGRCSRRHGGVVLDAPVLEVQAGRGRSRRRDRGYLESARQPRVPRRRARTADGRGPEPSGPADGRADRGRGLVVAITAFALVLSRAERAQSIGDGGRGSRIACGESCAEARSRGVASRSRDSAPRRSACSAAAGTSSRSRRSPAISPSSSCSSSACASPESPSSEVTVIEAFAAWALVRILGALPAHARRGRRRRGRSDRRARGVRRARMPRPSPRRCSTARSPCCRRSRSDCSSARHLAHTPPGGDDRVAE